MKRILLIVLLLTLLYPQATDAKKTKTDSLLLVIEQHDRTRLISAANQLMAFYYKEETSDEPLRVFYLATDFQSLCNIVLCFLG